MSDPREVLGREGEKRAERYLRKQGLKCLARRFRTPAGELDLVFRDGDTIVVVEVKTQRNSDFIDPEMRVTRAKQQRMARATMAFLRAKRLEDRPLRFDIVTLIWPADGEPQIEHIPAAFTPKMPW